MKKIKTVVACVWMMCMSLCVFAAQPSKGQIENINLIPILYSNRLDCLKFNPKYQQVYVIKTVLPKVNLDFFRKAYKVV